MIPSVPVAETIRAYVQSESDWLQPVQESLETGDLLIPFGKHTAKLLVDGHLVDQQVMQVTLLRSSDPDNAEGHKCYVLMVDFDRQLANLENPRPGFVEEFTVAWTAPHNMPAKSH